MPDNAGNQAKWAKMKCLAADLVAAGVTTNTGNAARVYGTASGIETSSISASATGALATALSTAAA